MNEGGDDRLFSLDMSVLDEAGLGPMPADKKVAFLQHIEEELDLRIGKRMSGMINDTQWVEFEKLSGGDQSLVNGILSTQGDYKNDEVVKLLAQAAGTTVDNPDFQTQYAVTKWIEKNCPGYEKVVEEELLKMVEELKSRKDQILAETA